MKTQEFKSMGLVAKLKVFETVDEYDQKAGKVGACLDSGNRNMIYRGRGGLADVREFVANGITDADIKEDPKLFVEGATSTLSLGDVTGIERKASPSLDKEKKPIVKDGEVVMKFDEDEEPYLKRVCAELTDKAKEGDVTLPNDLVIKRGSSVEPPFFQFLADSVCAILVPDPAERERKSAGPKKLAAKYKEIAGALLANGNYSTFLSDRFAPLVGRTPTFTLTNDMTKTFTGTNQKDKSTFSVSDKDAESLGWLVKEWSLAREAKELMEATI